MTDTILILNPKDNVATALRPLDKDEAILVEIGGKTEHLLSAQPVPSGHKVALKNIKRGETIIKYGEIIGVASVDIKKGEHVHIHNVEGLKGRGDKT
jgi:altronate dehydratase small subunit